MARPCPDWERAGRGSAPLASLTPPRAGTVQRGKYLFLIGGLTADVEESLAAGREIGAAAIVDFVYLPRVHPEVVEAIGGGRVPRPIDALGVVETPTVAAAIQAADFG